VIRSWEWQLRGSRVSVAFVLSLKFVAARFGEWVEESRWTTADDRWPDVVEGIGIEVSSFGFLSVDGTESESVAVGGRFASEGAEQRGRQKSGG